MKSIQFLGRSVIPSKIVCVGRNYAEHISELGNEVPESMVLFVKPNSAISDALHAGKSEEHHFEAELSFLVAKGSYAGIGLGIDVTRRGVQAALKSKGLPWERSKAFDGSAVFSEFVEYHNQNLGLELIVNGRVAQRAEAGMMIHSPDAILEEIQTFMTLEDGDIVMTGTPGGVGAFYRGDQFQGKVCSDDTVLVEREWRAQ